MKIIICYSSKLSVSLSDDQTKKVQVTSLSTISEPKKDAAKGDKVTIGENDSYEDIMFKLGEYHPNFKYNPISQNTVLGILSRLLGEIRYLDCALQEEDHIINKLKGLVSFNMIDRTMFNEIIRIETPLKDVQNNGGGLIDSQNSKKILLNKNEVSELIYSMLNMTNLNEVKDFINFIENAGSLNEVKKYLTEKNIFYKGLIEITEFAKKFEECDGNFKNIDQYYRKTFPDEKKKDKVLKEETEESRMYVSLLKKLGKINYNDDKFYFQSKFINMPGILCYTITRFMIRIGQKSKIDDVLIDAKKENIKGIAPSSGGITLREIYAAFSPKKVSFNSPYFISAKFFDKKANKEINQSGFNIGVGKEDGVLEIDIDVDVETAKELKHQIKCVAVQTFQVGKKGLGYVKEIKIDE
jgi:hypothetical protein